MSTRMSSINFINREEENLYIEMNFNYLQTGNLFSDLPVNQNNIYTLRIEEATV